MKKTLFCIAVALAFAVVAENAELKTGQLKWKLTRYCKIVNRDGKQFLQVDVPKGSKDISKQNCAFAAVDLKPFAGRTLQASIRARGRDVSTPAQPYNGVKFLLYYKTPNGGEHWPGAEIPKGTFGWFESKISEDIPQGTEKGTLRLGLQESSGWVEFDLSTLRIGVPHEEEEQKLPVTPELAKELDLIESRMRERLLAGPPVQAEEAKKLLASQRPDGTFDGVDYDDDNRSIWHVARHLGNALRLARAWAIPGHELYHDEAAGRAIRKAVAWWGEKRPQSSNWWWNDMSTPQTMGNILLLAPELFPEGPVRANALKVCRQAKFLPRYTGNNRVFIAQNIFRRALLERNVAPLTEAAAALSEEISWAPTVNKTAWAFGGIRADGCYHQHGPQIQFGNYGGEFYSNIGYWANIWKGTRWELSPQQWELMRHLSFNGFQWVLWNGEMDLLAIGRQLGRDAAKDKGGRAMMTLERLKDADPGPHEKYDAALMRNRGGKNTLVGSRHFWNSDYMVHRRPEWYAAVRMNSERVRPVEDDTNWDNALGRYFSDGVCLVMRSGKEYDNITACWDWTRLPGTTLPKTPVYTPEESAKRGLRAGGKPPRWTHSVKFRQIGETEFVGGVTDGTHGVAVFTMNLDGVQAQKGYFFDTDAIYELGNGISSESPYPVATTVNSCLRNGEIRQGENWFWHDGIGYLGEGMTLETGKRKGDWRYLSGGLMEPAPEEKELFTLTVDHGMKPRNASYAFAILPGATPEETAVRKGGKILSATEKLQAVEFGDGTVGAIFYAPGKLGAFETGSPGLFLIGSESVFAADPTAKLKTMTLTLNGKKRTVELPKGEEAGRSIEVR
ncbi:MAG: hypothetical protein HPZ91_03515 [Lentisphaeria bacterium]|nr:hypothetical protein [Lentisphaeria bacterium]